MTIGYNVEADFKEAQKYVRFLGKGLDRATARALNKTATPVRAEAAREIQQKRNLKIGRIKQGMRIDRARPTKLIARIVASGKPIAIRHFGARQTRQGVTVKVSKKGGRVRLQRFGNKSFIIPQFGGNVFVRKTNKRLPIQEWPRVPGIPSVFVQQQVLAAMNRVAVSTWRKRFREEIRFEIRRAAEKARRGA